MARAALGWGVRDLAKQANKSPTTVAALERGDTLRPETITEIRLVLERAGIRFIEENGGGPGVRLRKRKR